MRELPRYLFELFPILLCATLGACQESPSQQKECHGPDQCVSKDVCGGGACPRLDTSEPRDLSADREDTCDGRCKPSCRQGAACSPDTLVGDGGEGADGKPLEDVGVDAARCGGECRHFDGSCPVGCTPSSDTDCAQPPPTPIDVATQIPKRSDFSDVVYIDPSHASPGDGSAPDRPLASWDGVSFDGDTAYLQKRGTRADISSFTVDANRVLLGAYGSGARPELADGEITVLGDRVTVRDLEIVGHWLAINHPNPHPEHTVVYNNVIRGADYGIRSAGYHTRILGNEIHDIQDDGIFVQYAHDVEIAGNYVHDVNQSYHEDQSESHAPGDGIQFDRVSSWWVHHNRLDRTDTGNKFCFIATRDFPDTDQRGTFEYNRLAGPRTNGASIFLGGEPDEVHVRHNTFAPPSPTALYSHTDVHVYGNVIEGVSGGVNSSSNEAYVYNNVFTGIDGSVFQGGGVYVYNNVLDDESDVGGVSERGNNVYRNRHSQGVVFADAPNGDYRPAMGSPLLNAGSWQPLFTDAFTRDADGSPVPRDNSIDVGAFQGVGAGGGGRCGR